jgi:hypothetical protein
MSIIVKVLALAEDPLTAVLAAPVNVQVTPVSEGVGGVAASTGDADNVTEFEVAGFESVLVLTATDTGEVDGLATPAMTTVI